MSGRPAARRSLPSAATPTTYVVKAAVADPRAATFEFRRHRTMYGGKRIRAGDTVFVFASEHDGGQGLIACGVVTAAKPIPRTPGIERQTPSVDVVIRRTATAKRRLGRAELRPFSDWKDGRPETELNFKLYRQATNKIVGVTDATAAFLHGFVGRPA